MSAMGILPGRHLPLQGRTRAAPTTLAQAPCSVTLRPAVPISPYDLKRGALKFRQFWNARCLRASKGPLPLSVATAQVEPASELRASPSAQDILDWNLEGWKVVLEETGEAVGSVEEVMSLASFWDPSVVEYCLLRVFDSNAPGIEYLIPWVEDIVREVDTKAQCILIKPPEGLMELAKRPELLRKIRIALEQFGLHTEGQTEPHMPTRRQLQAAGEQKLVEMIVAAGGFSSVAQDLRLRTKRRPVGFWEDLQNLDSEIELFLGESWREEVDPDTGKTCYINFITGEMVDKKPPSGSIMDPIPVSQDLTDYGTAVMPRARTLRKMARFDLHNAIMKHGGYKEVAQQLGRMLTGSRELGCMTSGRRELGRMIIGRREVRDLESEIQEFMRDHNLALFPKPAHLIAEKREDLLIAVRKKGGVVAVAKTMGLRAQRNGKGRWKNLEEAVEAMKEYLLEDLLDAYPDVKSMCISEERREAIWKEAVEKGFMRLPKQVDIIDDGRRDLRYALQKFGQEAIAERLGIKKLTMRRPRIRRV